MLIVISFLKSLSLTSDFLKKTGYELICVPKPESLPALITRIAPTPHFDCILSSWCWPWCGYNTQLLLDSNVAQDADTDRWCRFLYSLNDTMPVERGYSNHLAPPTRPVPHLASLRQTSAIVQWALCSMCGESHLGLRWWSIALTCHFQAVITSLLSGGWGGGLRIMLKLTNNACM